MPPDESDRGSPRFSPTRGGLIYRAERALGLIRHDGRDPARRAIAYGLIAWLVPVLVGLGHALVTGHWDPILFAFETHARILVALPLLFVADEVIGRTAEGGAAYLVEGGLVTGTDLPRLRGVIAWAERVCNNVLVEVGILVAVVGYGVFTVVRTQPAGAASWSYLVVGKPVFLLFLYRWGWRWAIWAAFLWRVSRLELRLAATHPDRAGGLALLAHPSFVFGLVVSAMASVLAASWGSEVVYHGARLQEFAHRAAVFVALAVVLAVGPLYFFSSRLYYLKRRALRDYGALALLYGQLFEAKWVPRGGEGLLGTGDIQSLADMANSYQVIAELRYVPFPVRHVIVVALSALAPMLPLLLTVVPLDEILAKIAEGLL